MDPKPLAPMPTPPNMLPELPKIPHYTPAVHQLRIPPLPNKGPGERSKITVELKPDPIPAGEPKPSKRSIRTDAFKNARESFWFWIAISSIPGLITIMTIGWLRYNMRHLSDQFRPEYLKHTLITVVIIDLLFLLKIINARGRMNENR